MELEAVLYLIRSELADAFPNVLIVYRIYSPLMSNDYELRLAQLF